MCVCECACVCVCACVRACVCVCVCVCVCTRHTMARTTTSNPHEAAVPTWVNPRAEGSADIRDDPLSSGNGGDERFHGGHVLILGHRRQEERKAVRVGNRVALKQTTARARERARERVRAGAASFVKPHHYLADSDVEGESKLVQDIELMLGISFRNRQHAVEVLHSNFTGRQTGKDGVGGTVTQFAGKQRLIDLCEEQVRAFLLCTPDVQPCHCWKQSAPGGGETLGCAGAARRCSTRHRERFQTHTAACGLLACHTVK